MKNNVVLALFVGASVCLGGCSVSKKINEPSPKREESAEKMPSKEEMMAKWQDFSTPGPEHKALNQMVGTWNHTVEWWMEPGSPPEKSTGKSDIKWTMGNRYLEHNVSGKSMGMPFQGKGILAFDKANHLYRSVWYDSMGTGLMIGAGKYDPASKTINDTGTASCPLKGLANYRAVTTFIDPTHFRYEMFMQPPGAQGEMKVMNIEYTKKKA